jgi:hypothetical protein
MLRSAVALAAGALAAVAPAAAAEPLAPWDGTNPFDCELQQAGFAATGPNPEADPYCVEFDKRRQNLTELGVVEFLSREPGRVATALPKCFYFQSDHWRGSVVQADGSTKTYEWDGHYFYDRATGSGGVWVTNANVGGHSGDATTVPGFPAEWARYFGHGTGGVVSRNAVETDPDCVAQARARSPYAVPPPAEREPSCAAPAGEVTRRAIGPVAVGAREPDVRSRLGEPARVHRGFLRYCLEGGGKYAVGFAGDRSGEAGAGDERAQMVLTTSRGYSWRGLRPGARPPRGRLGPRVMRRGRSGAVHRPARGLLVGVRRGRVSFLAVHARGARVGELLTRSR